MAKCDKCGEEYPDGTEHVCSSPEEQKAGTDAAPEETSPEETS